MEQKPEAKIKPLLTPSKCQYQVGLSASGAPVCCPRKADIIFNGKPMCWTHAKNG